MWDHYPTVAHDLVIVTASGGVATSATVGVVMRFFILFVLFAFRAPQEMRIGAGIDSHRRLLTSIADPPPFRLDARFGKLMTALASAHSPE
jgi:hypothetical protein